MEKIKHSRIKITFLVTTIFLILLSILSYVRIQSLINAGTLVNHTQQVKLELESIIKKLREAESSQRGFIITKDSAFLNDYYKVIATIDEHVNKVAVLTIDNTLQQQNLAAKFN